MLCLLHGVVSADLYVLCLVHGVVSADLYVLCLVHGVVSADLYVLCMDLHKYTSVKVCHESGKTSVLAVRCCCFVTNNNGHPSLTHVHAVPQQSHTACSHTCTLGDPLTDSLSHATSYACHNHDISFSLLL